MGDLGRGIIDWNSDGKILTAEQKRFYQQNGYLVIRNCVSEADIDRYYDRFKYIVHADKSEFPYVSVMRDITLSNTQVVKDVNQVTKIQTWQDDEVLFDYCKTPLIVDILKDLIGTPQSNLVAMHTVLINKPLDTGAMSSRHPMHQDLQYFPFRPADFICTAWTAMQTVNRDNGCLTFVPGTHKGPLLPHVHPDWQANNKAYHGIRDFDPSTPRVHVEMEKGDTVFFHPLIHHGSGANKTDGFRRAISCHYANDDLCYYSDERNETQDSVDKDLMEIFERKLKNLGIELDMEDLDYSITFKIRSRPVNGTKSNL
uniref:phytanoyl-CoA dioxygenase n=1 Tax=Pristionchus pacificus TaxID=54126 RepID=A0A8R1YAK5_PRIPA